jgi:hypothetical protein
MVVRSIKKENLKMLTYEEGLKTARAILAHDPSYADPKNLSDNLLNLVLQCLQDEEASEIALPIMLVLHFCSNDQELIQSNNITTSLHHKFYCYRLDCEAEFKKRHLNIIQFHHYDKKSIKK